MRGSTIKIDLDAPKEAEKEPEAPAPAPKVAGTPARSVWERLTSSAADYEQRFAAVQMWYRSGECTEEMRRQIRQDPALEEFDLMVL